MAESGPRPDHDARFAPARVEAERSPRGLLLRSPLRLPPGAVRIGDWLRRWAHEAPERPFLTERDGSGRRILDYREAAAGARAVGEAFLARGLSPERPLLILAENGIDHALFMLGAFEAGLPVAPVSTAYARLSQDFGKLRHIVDLIRPELVFVDEPARYGAALEAVDWGGAELVAGRGADARPATPFRDLLATQPSASVAQASARVGPDTVAKILFTSGSTALPKGVINTHRMLTSNQEAMARVWPFVESRAPVLVDWLPWHHTFGGNFNFGLVLRNGGTLHIDEGRPAPGLFAESVVALRSAEPTIYCNVPRGFAFLLDALDADPDLGRHLFARLDLVMYAAAALPDGLWQRLEASSRAARGHVVPMVAAWGMTETAPCATAVHFPIPRAGVIGLPVPGTDILLVPVDDRQEIRVRGPNVTPGYFGRPDLTDAAFADGWLRTGDAARLADPDDPSKGVVFDGRIAENFKLTSGTWINVGVLRPILLTEMPLLADAVICGHDRDELAVLGLPNWTACRGLCPDLPADASLAQVAAHRAVRAAMGAGLARHNAALPGSSTAVSCLLLLIDPLSIDAGEITDKGYINQRAVLTRRALLVERLYGASPDDGIIRPEADQPTAEQGSRRRTDRAEARPSRP